MQIDLNADLGEGCACDADLMPLITSANIGCGAHAGDADTMYAALSLAREFGTQVGAHPGFPDREHFGRRELRHAEQEVFQDCVYQIGALQALAQAAGVPIRYLKPHGALYNLACRDSAFARPVVRAAQLFGLAVVGLPDSVLARAVKEQGLRFVAEGFADRRYLPAGSLASRDQKSAFIEDPAEAVRQVDWLINDMGVQTICVHGDNPQALVFVRKLREFLTQQGWDIKSF